MNKSIKVSDEVYEYLDAQRVKRETFNQVLERLVAVYKMMHEVSETLGASHFLQGEKSPGRDPVREATLDRRDLDSRTLKGG